jgi:hypothetical protein
MKFARWAVIVSILTASALLLGLKSVNGRPNAADLDENARALIKDGYSVTVTDKSLSTRLGEVSYKVAQFPYLEAALGDPARMEFIDAILDNADRRQLSCRNAEIEARTAEYEVTSLGFVQQRRWIAALAEITAATQCSSITWLKAAEKNLAKGYQFNPEVLHKSQKELENATR